MMSPHFLISFWLTLLAVISNLTTSALDCLKLTESDRPVLFCQNSISQLPLNRDDIPPYLSKVRILGSSRTARHNRRLSQVNLTGLESLTYLEISNFDLEFIEADTFKQMDDLRVLDLSRNHITTIQPGAFSGLTLDLLSLTDNAGLNLVRGIFRNTEVKNLAVRNCGLRDIDYTTIAEAKPRQLRLSHNHITTLDLRFEKILKPWMSSSTSLVSDMDEWGFIDLTSNPLDCGCQIAWIPRVMEEQLYAAQSSDQRNEIDSQAQMQQDANIELPPKRMYQLNLTCASPPNLAGKALPQSWHFYCPKPAVVGIVVSLLTPQADHAQLTCVGQGQPPPRLAWSYRLNGHKVQKTLDTTSPALSAESTGYAPFGHDALRPMNSDARMLHTRSIALNVSLRQPSAKNFTCTVWNDDSSDAFTKSHPFDLIDRLKSKEFDAFEDVQTYRMHEVTVRIHGPPEAQTDQFLDAKPTSSSNTPPIITNESIRNSLIAATEDLVNLASTGPYDYLFVERFSLLQLIGAIFGTFIVTLAFLYTVTHFLSCLCRFPLKDITRKRKTDKSGKRRFSLIHPRDMNLFSSSQDTPERTPLNETSLSKTFNCDSAFSLLTSGTTGNNQTQGPSTVPVRKPTVPQALLLTGVPAPPGRQNSTTPPLNPAYWSMPEYTYTGTGSHEYDVPRPLESLIGSQPLVHPDAQSILNMTNQAFLTNPQVPQQHGYDRNAISIQNGLTMPAVASQWPHVNPELSALNALMAWGQIGNPTSNGFPAMLDRQLPSVSYTHYPPSNSAVYTPDYPAYLQTRPYPHHQNKPQPLIQMMAQTNQMQTVNPQETSTLGQSNPVHNRSNSDQCTESNSEQNT